MVTVQNLGVHFSGNFLFENINMLITKEDRIGLVGRNGCGKSTYLKALSGQQAFEGAISKSKDTRIGYLKQDLNHLSGQTVLNETKKAYAEVLEFIAKRDECVHALETRTDYESDSYLALVDDLTLYEERIVALGGDTMEKDISVVLSGLGFSNEDLNKPTDEFSGGWQMRIELAKLLLQRPDLLLLDEPTNHLDIVSIQWLEHFLVDYPGAVMLVSHDRAFLDNVCNRTVEITPYKVYDFKAAYSKFLEQKALEKEMTTNAAKNQEREIKQIERNIEKFRAKANKAKFAQSLIKKLDKMEVIEVDQDDIMNMRLKFPEGKRSGREVIKVNDLSKQYDDLLVLDDINLVVERGDRVAFVGKNGEGKSTLSKIVVDEIEATKGSAELGINVELGYFAQHQAEALDGNSTVFEVIDNAATGDLRTKVRDILGAFLFSGESVHKKVKVLSGGERARLALCKMMLEPSNLLVLDEPTNHLDMLSKDVLKQALQMYEGTLVVVSHDREFLEGLTTKVYEFKNRKIKEHLGDVYEFLKKNEIETFRQFESADLQKKKNDNLSTSNTNIQQKEKKELEKEKRNISKEIGKIESSISKWEKEVETSTEKLADPELYQDKSAFKEVQDALAHAESKLEEKMEAWEELAAQMDTINQKIKG